LPCKWLGLSRHPSAKEKDEIWYDKKYNVQCLWLASTEKQPAESQYGKGSTEKQIAKSQYGNASKDKQVGKASSERLLRKHI
jgi:hypothetical protein